MLRRRASFAAWALIGATLSYGALYAFSPFGLVIIAVALVVAFALPALNGRRWPEALGVLAGPGVFCLIVAAGATNPAGWAVAGAAIVAAAAAVYALVRRTGTAGSA